MSAMDDLDQLKQRIFERVKQMAAKTCSCGATMWQGSGYFSTDFMCDSCGAEYNSAGNRLAPRSQWGEETGEQF